jgi:para-nitrobenzyl esterase
VPRIGRRTALAGLVSLAGSRAAAAGCFSAIERRTVPVTVDAPCGPVQGLRSTCAVFLGIPYAAQPVGALRYASPQPAARWTEPLEAKDCPASIQTLGGAAAWLYEGGWTQDEACLGLNVWSPDVKGRAPVMVWLHGGAWRTGYGNAAGTMGFALAASGVVLVTVNYRLGALGWLAHPALRDPATGAFANWGLQDQIAALRWVKDNIAAFGGDPGNITLFGQSAGGSSTASIAQDPRNAGLLHKAIIESGSLHGAPGFPEVDTAAAYAEALARKLGTDVPGLRTLPALAVHKAELELGRDPAMVRSLGRPPVLPVLDGTVLKVWPRDGTLPAIPLLIGTTQTEGTFWFDLIGPDGKPVVTLKPPGSEAELHRFIADLAAIYQPEASVAPEKVAAAYTEAARSRDEPSGVLPIWVAAYTDIVFRLRARAAARRHAAAGHTAYLYEFQRPLAAPAHGVPHTAEIPYVFGTWSGPFFAGKTGCDAGPLSAALTQAWAAFAQSGSPGKGWAQAAADRPVVNRLGGPAGLLAPTAEVRLQELAVWGAV